MLRLLRPWLLLACCIVSTVLLTQLVLLARDLAQGQPVDWALIWPWAAGSAATALSGLAVHRGLSRQLHQQRQRVEQDLILEARPGAGPFVPAIGLLGVIAITGYLCRNVHPLVVPATVILMCGALFISWKMCVQLLGSKSVLRLDPQGITYLHQGFIPWSAVAGIGLEKTAFPYFSQAALCLGLHHDKQFMRREPLHSEYPTSTSQQPLRNLRLPLYVADVDAAFVLEASIFLHSLHNRPVLPGWYPRMPRDAVDELLQYDELERQHAHLNQKMQQDDTATEQERQMMTLELLALQERRQATLAKIQQTQQQRTTLSLGWKLLNVCIVVFLFLLAMARA
jgi:hypothetical protein